MKAIEVAVIDLERYYIDMSKPLRIALYASTVTLVGCMIAMVGFTDTSGNSYSIFRHFISELGDSRYAPNAVWFNASEIALGILFYMWFHTFTQVIPIKNRTLHILAIMSAIAISLVGVFNRQIQPQHSSVALLTFLCVGLFMLIASQYLASHQHLHSRAANLTVKLISYVFILFISVHGVLYKPGYIGSVISGELPRPEFWVLAITEWGAYAMIILWIFSVSILSRQKVNDAI